jgi:hypothetical protein
MEKLHIKSTTRGPEILFTESYRLIIAGRIILEGAPERNDVEIHFSPLEKRIDEYLESPEMPLEVSLLIEYMSGEGRARLLKILRRLGEAKESLPGLTIDWYYESEDPDWKVYGEWWSGLVNHPFNLIEIEDMDKNIKEIISLIPDL